MAVQQEVTVCDARRILAALFVFGGWSLLSGAHGAPGPIDENGPPQINACSLLSQDAVSEVTGFSSDSGVRRDSGYASNGAYSSTCLWILDQEKSGTEGAASLSGRSFVILNVMRWPDGSDLAHGFLQAFHEAAARGEIPGEPVPRDFGDAALWWGDGLAVQKGDVSFGISVVIRGSEAGHPGELEERLALEILGRLERKAP